MVLDRNPENYFAEVEQVAFGTGVLVDGLDFSDDKLLQGRTFSYSDTQRYRVGPNYLQLPINAPKNARVATNQRDGQMTYHVDSGARRATRTSTTSRPAEAVRRRSRRRRLPTSRGLRQGRAPGDQPDQQLRSGWRALPHLRAVGAGRVDLESGRRSSRSATSDIQERMVWHLSQADAEYGRRVAEGLGIDASRVPPVPVAVAHGA